MCIQFSVALHPCRKEDKDCHDTSLGWGRAPETAFGDDGPETASGDDRPETASGDDGYLSLRAPAREYSVPSALSESAEARCIYIERMFCLHYNLQSNLPSLHKLTGYERLDRLTSYKTPLTVAYLSHTKPSRSNITTMSSQPDSTKKDLYKTPRGSIERLNLTNYIEWRTNVKTILKTMKAWEIVAGEEKEPTETPPAQSTRARSGEADNANLQLAIASFEERRNEAEALLRFSVNNTIQKQLRRMEDPAEMWVTLGNQFNSQTQRSIHASNLYTIKPRTGERISTYCERLLQHQDPANGTDEAISDSVLLQHLFNNTGPIFSQLTYDLRERINKISVQDAIDELCEFERNHLANHQVGDPGNNSAGTLLYSKGGGKTVFCKYCRKKGHHITDCRKKQRQNAQRFSGKTQYDQKDSQQTSGKKRSRDDFECWHCWQTGHTERNCPLKKRTEEFKARRNQKQFGSKGKAMAADGDSIEEKVLRPNLDRLTGHETGRPLRSYNKNTFETGYFALAAEKASSTWIIDSGASHHMYNGPQNRFRTYSRLPQPIDIRLGDNTVVQATHKGLVQIQNHWIKALHLPTLRYSFLSVGDLDTNGYRTTFENGRCTISDHTNQRTILMGNRSARRCHCVPESSNRQGRIHAASGRY